MANKRTRAQVDQDWERALKEAEESVDAQVYVREPEAAHRRRANRKSAAVQARIDAGERHIVLTDGRVRFVLCGGRNLDNEPCGLSPLKKGTELHNPEDGETYTATGGFCINHDEAVPESFVLAQNARGGGRKKGVGPDEFMRRVFLQAPRIFMRPYLDAIGAELDPDTSEIKRLPGKGAKIYGESKDGDIKPTDIDDLKVQIEAVEKLADRGFGRPKQSTEFTTSGGATSVVLPATVERAQEVALILQECGAVDIPKKEIKDD